jgi:dATP pyrophosphohydrolase
MGRAPFQVLVLPYRHTGQHVEYAIFRRADDNAWQGIAGGGENDETARDAAVREMREEAGITTSDALLQLESVGTIAAAHIRDRSSWDPELREIPEYAFGIDVGCSQLLLSDEHREVAWLTFDDAVLRLTYESNRAALRQLHARLSP